MKKNLITILLVLVVVGLLVSAIILTRRLSSSTPLVKETLAAGVTYSRTYSVDPALPTTTPVPTEIIPTEEPTETPIPTIDPKSVTRLPTTGVATYFGGGVVVALVLVTLAFIF